MPLAGKNEALNIETFAGGHDVTARIDKITLSGAKLQYAGVSDAGGLRPPSSGWRKAPMRAVRHIPTAVMLPGASVTAARFVNLRRQIDDRVLIEEP